MADFQRFHTYILNIRFVRFAGVGCCTTALDFAIFYFLHFIYGLAIIPANAVSYGTGIAIGFFINRVWTFHDAMHRSHRRVMLSLIYGYIGLILNTILVWRLSLYIPAMLAKTAAVLVILLYNYLTNKYLVFRVNK